MVLSWLRHTNKRRSTSHARGGGFRARTKLLAPRLEPLEDRCVPTTVTTTYDDLSPGSLRQAIMNTPSGGVVNFEPVLSGTITLVHGILLIDKDLTIDGPGAELITVSGN